MYILISKILVTSLEPTALDFFFSSFFYRFPLKCCFPDRFFLFLLRYPSVKSVFFFSIIYMTICFSPWHDIIHGSVKLTAVNTQLLKVSCDFQSSVGEVYCISHPINNPSMNTVDSVTECIFYFIKQTAEF